MLEQNLIKMFAQSFKDNRELPALSDYYKKENFSYFEVAREVAKLHMLFEECGVKQDTKIALIGRNNNRWVITYIAAITYGATLVPILQDFNANDIHHIINHSGAELLFVGEQVWDLIETNNIPKIKAAFILTDLSCIFERRGISIGKFQSEIKSNFRAKYSNGFTLDDIAYPEVPNDRIVVLNYTSGTTGFTKGVMLTVNNLTANVVFGLERKIHIRASRLVAFLPLAHAYGGTVDMLIPLAAGSHITLLGRMPAPKVLMEAMAEVRPNKVTSVPLILEKIVRKEILPLLDRKIVKIASRIPVFEKQVYAGIRRRLIEAFGGQMEQVIIGGASLNREIEEFLLRIKFPLAMGYGLTECAPLISYQSYDKFVPTSCGMILHGFVEVKIDSADPQNTPGEILVKGEVVMKGYYLNETATEAAFDDQGWLHTGDMGTIDPDGTLYIRGRCKTMLLGANGQNVYPEEIESKLNNLPCVMESLVLERKGKVVALVVPDLDQADALGLNSSGLADVMADNLQAINALVAPYEKLSDIILYPDEFEKTAKKSIKRYLYNV